MPDTSSSRFRLVLLPLCALLVVAPLLWHGNSCGNDFNFHLLSWMEVHAAWHAGSFYPHWAMQPNNGAGEPRFVFYPPISWMLGAFLGSLLGNGARGWSATPGAFVFVILTLAGFSSYALLRRVTAENAALLAACFYLANPYTLFVIYERSAFAELAAIVWMPLLILFALEKTVRILPLAWVITALWLTHDASAVMGCYALALLILLTALREKNWRCGLERIARASTSVGLGLGLAAFYIVPAAYERKWVQIQLAFTEGMGFAANFLFTRTDDSFHDSILFMVSWIAVGLIALGFAFSLVLLFFHKRRKLSKPDSLPLLPVVILTAILGFLLLPISLPVWHLLPELIFLQFPWRLLLLLGVTVSILLGATLDLVPIRARLLPLAAPLLVAVLTVCCYPRFHQFCDFQDVVPAQLAVFHTDKGYQAAEGTAEYTPLATIPENLPDSMPPVYVTSLALAHDPSDTPPPLPAAAMVRVEIWQPDHRGILIFLPSEDGHSVPEAAVLRLLDYPGWRIRINGQLLPQHLHTADGRLYVPLPAGASVLTVDYAATPDAWLGRCISLLSLFLVIGIFAFQKTRRTLSTSSPSV